MIPIQTYRHDDINFGLLIAEVSLLKVFMLTAENCWNVDMHVVAALVICNSWRLHLWHHVFLSYVSIDCVYVPCFEKTCYMIKVNDITTQMEKAFVQRVMEKDWLDNITKEQCLVKVVILCVECLLLFYNLGPHHR